MNPSLDSIDRHILEVLQRDGRIANQTLADTVGLSPSACLRRVRNLEEAGVITGYVAVLDPERIGAGRRVFVEITLESQRQDSLEAFERAVAGCPGVMSCHLMSGDADYLLGVAVSGLDGFERLHRDHLSRLPGVVRMRSSFAIRTVADRTAHALHAGPAPVTGRR
jgi:Lrp/AsnC family leucine-responsive transcriptional regulator